MKILVTGGAGYIGSHTAVSLLNAGFEVVIADDLSNSSKEVIDAVQAITSKKVVFYHIDVSNRMDINSIFQNHLIDAVIHFAGYKAVGESERIPLMYYRNNLLTTITLLEACCTFHVKRFVFSSSASVYGEHKVPFVEGMQISMPENPYAATKAICEKLISDAGKQIPGWSAVLLRYFNPVGAHESGIIGEAPQGTPNNLMPYITQVAAGIIPELKIFGSDYSTPDGTGVRDYIHVMDLAEGHVAALQHAKPGLEIYNLGTGSGTSVLELLRTFEKANQIMIPYRIVDRRAGDLAICYANVDKAKKELSWMPQRNLFDMCRDAWNYEKNRRGI